MEEILALAGIAEVFPPLSRSSAASQKLRQIFAPDSGDMDGGVLVHFAGKSPFAEGSHARIGTAHSHCPSYGTSSAAAAQTLVNVRKSMAEKLKKAIPAGAYRPEP